MAIIARQRRDNTVVGIDAEGLIQRLMLFDHCIIPSIWLKDIQFLLRIVDPVALCELIDCNALSFYIDTATQVEIGQARSHLNLTGNTAHLKDNEFSFSIIKGKDDLEKTKIAIDELARTDGVPAVHAKSVAERVEATMIGPKGLELHQEAFKEFYRELRSPDSTVVRDLIANKLRSLGAKPSRLEIKIEEFVEEDFRINSNLTTIFGLSSQKAREISLRSLFDLASVYIRLAHMRAFSCILGMNATEQIPWEMKVDSLTQNLISENLKDRQFIRIAEIAGLGENQLFKSGKINLRRLIELRQSDDLTIFKAWLKQSDNKSDKEIRERVTNIRGKIGNLAQSARGKTVRLMLASLPALIHNQLGCIDIFTYEIGLDLLR